MLNWLLRLIWLHPRKIPLPMRPSKDWGTMCWLIFPKVASSYNVEFVEGQPYDTAAQMSNELMKTGVMKVSKDFNQSEVFGEMENLFFRAVHDYYGHSES